MKSRLGVKDSRPLADFLPTLTIAAKNLATEMTNYNVEEKDLQGERAIIGEHVQNNLSVRQMLGQRGIKPGDPPPYPCSGDLPGWKLCPYAGLRTAAPYGRYPVGQQEVHEHEALRGCLPGRLYCWLTSFSQSLQTILRITLDSTICSPSQYLDGRGSNKA